MKRPIVLSVEQALSMSYATLRFVHLGWRVIRLEPTPVSGRRSKGDPNRYIGRPVAGEDRHSYCVAPNVGKEAIALNLKEEEGQELLHRLIRELPVDIFCTNTMPARHQGLGFDYETLSALRPELVWCSISAMGIGHPKVPGYDPMIQALTGYMDITGHSDGPPLLCGPPLVDLKAGDEAFAQVLLALLERAETGKGSMIDVSMARAAASWLHTFLPMLDMDSPPEELRRSGNEHRQFIPVNAYPASDGYIYIALGSDAQWQRFVACAMFSSLEQPRYGTNEGRRANKTELWETMKAITEQQTTADVAQVLAQAGVPHSRINAIEDVMNEEWLAPDLLGTTAPDGRRVRLPPAAVNTPYLDEIDGEIPFTPAYGESTDAVLTEIGLDTDVIGRLHERGVVA